MAVALTQPVVEWWRMYIHDRCWPTSGRFDGSHSVSCVRWSANRRWAFHTAVATRRPLLSASDRLCSVIGVIRPRHFYAHSYAHVLYLPVSPVCVSLPGRATSVLTSLGAYKARRRIAWLRCNASVLRLLATQPGITSRELCISV